jgi:ABC-type lipoprotein release transport system permease subunit
LVKAGACSTGVLKVAGRRLVVPGALLALALASCWIPARRAVQVQPVIAL